MSEQIDEPDSLPPGHTLDEDGDHDEESCYQCLLGHEVKSDCRCGNCCRHLLIEVLVEDAEREPKIAEKGSPIYQDPRLIESGQKELIGYYLNGEDGCVFLDQATNGCGIYATRPLICRLFDCKTDVEDLIQLGIRVRDD